MTGPDASSGNTTDGINGAGLSADDALAGARYLSLGWTAYNETTAPYGWVFESGKLPYIQPFDEVSAASYDYLTQAAGTDQAAPELNGETAVGIGATFATLRFASSEAGAYYCLVLADSETAPLADAIKTSGVSGTVSDTYVNSITAAGLTASIGYVAYLIAEDAVGNTSAVSEIAFTTGASDETAIPPLINGAYRISNAEQLAWFRDLVNGALTGGIAQNAGADAVLTADIDLSGVCGDGNSWTPIGSSDEPYTGVFDGAEYTVSDLYINVDADYQALFGAVDSGTIKDLTVSGSITNAGEYTAGIAACVSAGVLTNCVNEAEVTSQYSYVGGVAGTCKGMSQLTGCENKGDVTGVTTVGGVAGYAIYASLTDCVNTGSVNGSGRDIGGICGYGAQLKDCSNSGAVTGTNKYVGGIVGGVGGSVNSSVIGCENTGAVTGASCAGGIVGYILTEVIAYIADCSNSGAVSGTATGTSDSGQIGGLFGSANLNGLSGTVTVASCYNTGDVSDTSSAEAAGGVGGLGGYVTGRASFTLQNCYNAGNVTGTKGVGGLLGVVEAISSAANITATNCYSAGAVTIASGEYDATLSGGIGQTLLANDATADDIYFSNLFYKESGELDGIGDNTAGVDPCTVGAVRMRWMRSCRRRLSPAGWAARLSCTPTARPRQGRCPPEAPSDSPRTRTRSCGRGWAWMTTKPSTSSSSARSIQASRLTALTRMPQPSLPVRPLHSP